MQYIDLTDMQLSTYLLVKNSRILSRVIGGDLLVSTSGVHNDSFLCKVIIKDFFKQADVQCVQ